MSDNEHEHGPTNDQKMVASVNIPDEIFEHHIWKHFSFHQWIRVFSFVCKKWKRICEESTVDPKQIQIEHYRIHEIGHFILIVKKYQPTILQVNLSFSHSDIFLVTRMCEVSKRLHTLVIECPSHNGNFDMYVKPIEHITTLALKVEANEKFWQNLRIIFPNLKRLQLESPNEKFPITVDHLTVIGGGYITMEDFKVLKPHVLVSQMDKTITTKHGSDSTKSRNLTYEEYYQYFGETELLTALEHQDLDKAVELLRSGVTTMEYDQKLYESNTHYQYPSVISWRAFNPLAYWSAVTRTSHFFDIFTRNNLLPIPTSEKFVALARFKRKKEALEELSKLNGDSSLIEYSYDIGRAFYSDFLPVVTKEELHQKEVIEVVRKIVQYSTDGGIDENDWDKISDLRDWSGCEASTSSACLCYKMVALGCKVSPHNLESLEKKEDVSSILDLIAEKNPSNLFCLLYYPFEKLKPIMKRLGIALTIEKDGVSLFNKRIQFNDVTDQELIEYKHLVNHMDSSGTTPLSAALSSYSYAERVWPKVKKLLELGADPTLHRSDKPSPLGLLLEWCSSIKEIYNSIDAINLLIEHGADVNAPCLYQERMCSPLMIAALSNTLNEHVLSFLVALGARIDYCDETGRSVMDCIKSDYYKQFMNKLSKSYQ